MMYSVTVSLPRDMAKLEEKYNDVLADMIIDQLSNSEVEYLLSEYKKQQKCS